MTEQLSVLSVGAHRKDAIIHSGGTLAKHVNRGDRVCALSVTHGVRTHHHRVQDALARDPETVVDVEALMEEIEAELDAAAAELGITDVRCFRYDDAIVTEDKEIIRDIANVICEFRPDLVITHWPQDGHAAHGYVGQMTRLAVETAAAIQTDGIHQSHYIKALYYHIPIVDATVFDGLTPKPVTTLVDITDVIQQKYRAMNHFRHQYYGGENPFNRAEIEILDGIFGLAGKVPYVEPFIPHKPAVFDHLPVSKYAMGQSASTFEEGLRYSGQMLLEP